MSPEATEVERIHVDAPGDYVMVPAEEFNSLMRTLTLLVNEEFKGQFKRSKDSKGKSLEELKEKYDISA